MLYFKFLLDDRQGAQDILALAKYTGRNGNSLDVAFHHPTPNTRHTKSPGVLDAKLPTIEPQSLKIELERRTGKACISNAARNIQAPSTKLTLTRKSVLILAV